MSDVRAAIYKLKELKKMSTPVNSWYHNGGTVRGPFNRWLEVTAVSPEYEKNVASGSDDAAYASAAMNMAPLMIELIENLESKIQKLEAELEIDKMLRTCDE
jgi:hypothetical protein